MENSQYWKKRINELLHTCQDELQRATKIGKKMLSATKANSSLHELYEELGLLTVKAMEQGELTWENPKVKELIEKISSCKKDLEAIENEVNEIKFSGQQTGSPDDNVKGPSTDQ